MEKFITKADIKRSPLQGDEYYLENAISASALKQLKVSPAHYKYGEPMKESDAIRFGRAYHSFILTPEVFADEYFLLNDAAIFAQLIAKGYKAPRMTKDYKEWAAKEAESAGQRTVIGMEEMEKMTDMKRALMAHPYARTLISGGEAETGYMGSIETIAGAINVKMKPDYINGAKQIIVDLKTARDSSTHGFARAAADLNYHIQAAFYVDLVQMMHNKEFTFFFIAQETEKPYAVNVFEASEQFISQGRYEYELLLSLYKWCIDNNKWPSYEVFNQNKYGVEQLDLPAWAIKPLEYYTK